MSGTNVQSESQPPRVSVVMPVYNGERYVADALESVRAQTYPVHEVIAVDDGSTDDTARLLDEMEDVRLVSQANRGSAAARNTGMKFCTGDLVAFLDADDVWEPDKTERQVAHLLVHPEIGFVVGMQRILLEPGVEPPAWLTEEMRNERTVAAGTCTLMIRKPLFEVVGPFDSTLKVSQDTDWFVRAVEIGIEMGIVRDATILRRFHGENATYDLDALRLNLHRIVLASVRRRREKKETGES